MRRRGPPNMARTVRRFCFDVQRERYAAPTLNADNLPVSAAPTVTTIPMHAFGAPPPALARLPEGTEASGAMMGHTPETDWSTGDEATGQRADCVLIGGTRYEVVDAGPWLEGPSGTESWVEVLMAQVQRT